MRCQGQTRTRERRTDSERCQEAFRSICLSVPPSIYAEPPSTSAPIRLLPCLLGGRKRAARLRRPRYHVYKVDGRPPKAGRPNEGNEGRFLSCFPPLTHSLTHSLTRSLLAFIINQKTPSGHEKGRSLRPRRRRIYEIGREGERNGEGEMEENRASKRGVDAELDRVRKEGLQGYEEMGDHSVHRTCRRQVAC